MRGHTEGLVFAEADEAEAEKGKVRVDEKADGFVGAGQVRGFVAGGMRRQRLGHPFEDGLCGEWCRHGGVL